MVGSAFDSVEESQPRRAHDKAPSTYHLAPPFWREPLTSNSFYWLVVSMAADYRSPFDLCHSSSVGRGSLKKASRVRT